MVPWLLGPVVGYMCGYMAGYMADMCRTWLRRVGPGTDQPARIRGRFRCNEPVTGVYGTEAEAELGPTVMEMLPLIRRLYMKMAKSGELAICVSNCKTI